MERVVPNDESEQNQEINAEDTLSIEQESTGSQKMTPIPMVGILKNNRTINPETNVQNPG